MRLKNTGEENLHSFLSHNRLLFGLDLVPRCFLHNFLLADLPLRFVQLTYEFH